MDERSRRSVLGGMAVVTTTALAGCLSGLVDDDDDEAADDQEDTDQAGDSEPTYDSDDIAVELAEAPRTTEPESFESGPDLVLEDGGSELVVTAVLAFDTPCHVIETYEWSYDETDQLLTIDVVTTKDEDAGDMCAQVIEERPVTFHVADPGAAVERITIEGASVAREEAT